MSFRDTLKWGWKRDRHDARDFSFVPKLTTTQILPVSDYRNVAPIVVDQGNLGSCVGNAVAGHIEIDQLQQGKVYYEPALHGKPVTNFVFAPSRLYIYYGGRSLEGTVASDEGCEIRDAIKFIAANGVCSSSKWPYHVSKFADEPTPECYAEAKARGRIISYHRLDNTVLHNLLACLSQGKTFVCGIQVYDSFMSDQVAANGMVPMPNTRTEQLQGGHAICIVGHNIANGHFIGRNSWGTGWGDKGYFYIPFSYLTSSSLTNDAWTVAQVE